MKRLINPKGGSNILLSDVDKLRPSPTGPSDIADQAKERESWDNSMNSLGTCAVRSCMEKCPRYATSATLAIVFVHYSPIKILP